MSKRVAVVFGGTGATGTALVSHLLESPLWAQVVTIGRREVDAAVTGRSPSKIMQIKVDMDKLSASSAAVEACKGANTTVFWTLGTTRAQAGSAAEFKKIELGWLTEAAKIARKGEVGHFSLCSAVGSNPNVWANDWPIFQVFLYAKTKGQMEEVVKGLGFPQVSIFRPGMLERGDRTRGVEKFFSNFMSTPKVSDLAKCMALDAEACFSGNSSGEERKPGSALVFPMKNLQAAAKAGKAPLPER